MLRIIEHRSALPFGSVVELHVSQSASGGAPVLATVEVTRFGKSLDPNAFPQPLPVADAFLLAIAYAERAGITALWINDPGSYFPPEKRPVCDLAPPDS